MFAANTTVVFCSPMSGGLEISSMRGFGVVDYVAGIGLYVATGVLAFPDG